MTVITLTEYNRITQAIKTGTYTVQDFADDMHQYHDALVSCEGSIGGCSNFIEFDVNQSSLLIWLCGYLELPLNQIIFCDLMARYPAEVAIQLTYRNRFGLSAINVALNRTPISSALFLTNNILPRVTAADLNHYACQRWILDHLANIDAQQKLSGVGLFKPKQIGLSMDDPVYISSDEDDSFASAASETGDQQTALAQLANAGDGTHDNNHRDPLSMLKTAEDFTQWVKANHLPAGDDSQDSTFVSYMSCALKGEIKESNLFVNSLCNMKARNLACHKVTAVLGRLTQLHGAGAASSSTARMYILDLLLKNYLESTVLLRVAESSDYKNHIYRLCHQYAKGFELSGFCFFSGDKVDPALVNNFFNIKFAEGRVSGIWKSFSDIANVTQMAEILQSIDVAEYEALKRSDVAKYILAITDSLDLSLSGHRPLAQKRILPQLKHIVAYDGNIKMIDLTL